MNHLLLKDYPGGDMDNTGNDIQKGREGASVLTSQQEEGHSQRVGKVTKFETGIFFLP